MLPCQGRCSGSDSRLPLTEIFMTLIWGKVISTQKVGKTLGFPTANIALHKDIPDGIYLSKVKVAERWYPALTFIGAAITFGRSDRKAESYLLRFDKEIYNEWITIQLLEKLRNNRRFESKEALIARIKADVQQAERYFNL